MIDRTTRGREKINLVPSLLVQSIARKKRTWKFRYKTLVSSEMRGEFWYWDMSQSAMILDRKIWLRKMPIGRIFGAQEILQTTPSCLAGFFASRHFVLWITTTISPAHKQGRCTVIKCLCRGLVFLPGESNGCCCRGFLVFQVNNGYSTEWSPIRFVIIRVIDTGSPIC